MVAAAGLPPGEASAQALRVHRMQSRQWCALHDAAARGALEEQGWDGAAAVSGWGKHWVAGASPGRAYLHGWWSGSAWIQPAPAFGSVGPHNDLHADYATTTMLRRSLPPSAGVGDAAEPILATVRSPHYSVGRPSGPPRVVVLHTTENDCAPGVAAAVASYFARPSTGKSAHYVVGPDAAFQCVADTDRAWHVGAPANAWTIGIEQTGRARYTAAEWAAPAQRAMLDRVVRLLARLCRRWSIPPVVLTPGDVAAGRSGIASHLAIGRGVGGTNHYDPGPGYPMDSVVARVAAVLSASDL